MSESTSLFSLKMRASENIGGKSVHISGAEKIVSEKQLADYATAMIDRGLHHSKGNADFLNIKIEKVDSEKIIYLDALPVTTVEVEDWRQGQEEIIRFLNEIGIPEPLKIVDFLKETYAMRGAMLLDINQLKRLEPDKERGIRATYMDQDRSQIKYFSPEKNHYSEAIVLATKVVNCPGIVGEICISDDPYYVTGYVASKECGYRRITKMKEMGSENGGRIFLYNGRPEDVHKTIDFLQCQRVIVRGVKALSCNNAPENPLKRFKDAVTDFKTRNLYRTMKTIDSAQGAHITVDAKEYVLMASNSYLDITRHPHMIESCEKALRHYGFGSGGSRLTTGNTDLHEKLEQKIADFKKCESAIVFNTGYVANVATISVIMKDGGIIFSDELNHASIIDGCRLSKAKCIVYKHNDMTDLLQKIEANPSQNRLAVSDAVFSMDGDILNLPEFVEICKNNGVLSMIDEAHSTGVIGKTGHGIVEHYNYSCKPDILMGTLSKAIGSEGGYVAGPQILIDFLRNTARGFIFSTSISPVTVAGAIAGLEIIEEEPGLVNKLHNNIEYFCNCLKELGIEQDSKTAIIPIIIGDEKKALDISNKLYENGFFISAIRYPTVARGQARLRVALMASHTEEELQLAAELISKYL